MNPIIPHPAPTVPISLPPRHPMNTPPASPAPAPWRQDRITRLTALAPEDAAAGLLWLAMTFPAVCDAMLDKLESDDIYDAPHGQEPEPFCSECGSEIGIFLRFGLEWRHYRGDGTTIGQIELTDPGHTPVVAWRLTSVPALR